MSWYQIDVADNKIVLKTRGASKRSSVAEKSSPIRLVHKIKWKPPKELKRLRHLWWWL